MKIGLLDDNPRVLEYMTVALELAGHTVYPYIYGTPLMAIISESAKANKSVPYDLLIVDLLLAGGESGVEMLKLVRALLSFETLPVIIVSAGTLEELEYVKERFPQVPVLRKPFQLHALLGAIEQCAALQVVPRGVIERSPA